MDKKKYISTVVGRMVDAGESDADIDMVVSGIKEKWAGESPTPRPSPLTPKVSDEQKYSHMIPPETWGDVGEDISQTVLKSDPLIRPALQGLGSAGGILAGMATGPAAPAAAPLGSAMGFAFGDEVADYVQRVAGREMPERTALQSAAHTSNQLAFGLAGESLGPVIAAVGKPIMRAGGNLIAKGVEVLADIPGIGTLLKAMAPVSEKAAMRRAGKELVEATADASRRPSFAADDADAILKEIPELQLSMGQRTADPARMRLGEEITHATPGARGDTAAIAQSNEEAIKSYFKKTFGGKENIDEVLEAIGEVQLNLEANTVAPEAVLNKIASTLDAGVENRHIGAKLKGLLAASKQESKNVINKEWGSLPDSRLTSLQTKEIISDISKLEKKAYDRGWDDYLPNNLLKQIKLKVKEQGFLTLQQARTYASSAGKLSADFAKQQKGIKADVARWFKKPLTEAIDAVDGEGYAAAKQLYATHDKTFRKGPVGKILNYSDAPVIDADIAGKFYRTGKTEYADQLINAVGKDSAKESMRQQALLELKSKNILREGFSDPKKYNEWFRKNKTVLKKFGIDDIFSTADNAAAALKAAEKGDAEFQRSIFAKVADVDPFKVMKNIFSGAEGERSKVTAEKMLRLLTDLKGDETALKGMRNSFSDYIYNTAAKDGAIDVNALNTLMVKFEPAMRVIYGGTESAGYKTMQSVRKAALLISRQSDLPAGGSDGFSSAKKMLRGVAPFVFKKYSRIAGANALTDIVSHLKGEAAEEMLVKALFDPQFEQKLINEYIKTTSPSLSGLARKAISPVSVGAGAPIAAGLDKAGEITGLMQ